MRIGTAASVHGISRDAKFIRRLHLFYLNSILIESIFRCEAFLSFEQTFSAYLSFAARAENSSLNSSFRRDGTHFLFANFREGSTRNFGTLSCRYIVSGFDAVLHRLPRYIVRRFAPQEAPPLPPPAASLFA